MDARCSRRPPRRSSDGCPTQTVGASIRVPETASGVYRGRRVESGAYGKLKQSLEQYRLNAKQSKTSRVASIDIDHISLVILRVSFNCSNGDAAQVPNLGPRRRIT